MQLQMLIRLASYSTFFVTLQEPHPSPISKQKAPQTNHLRQLLCSPTKPTKQTAANPGAGLSHGAISARTWPTPTTRCWKCSRKSSKGTTKPAACASRPEATNSLRRRGGTRMTGDQCGEPKRLEDWAKRDSKTGRRLCEDFGQRS